VPKNTKRKIGNRARTTTTNEAVSPQGETFIVRTSSEDPLAVQIAATVRKPKGIRLSKKVLQQAIEAKLRSPDLADPKGFKLRIVWWQNPSRNADKINPENGLPLNARRSYGSDKERWKTLRGPLLSARMDIGKVGKNK